MCLRWRKRAETHRREINRAHTSTANGCLHDFYTSKNVFTKTYVKVIKCCHKRIYLLHRVVIICSIYFRFLFAEHVEMKRKIKSRLFHAFFPLSFCFQLEIAIAERKQVRICVWRIYSHFFTKISGKKETKEDEIWKQKKKKNWEKMKDEKNEDHCGTLCCTGTGLSRGFFIRSKRGMH